jgi:hypothetical protein
MRGRDGPDIKRAVQERVFRQVDRAAATSRLLASSLSGVVNEFPRFAIYVPIRSTH